MVTLHHQDARLLRSIPKGVSDLCGQYPSCSGVNDSLCGSHPSLAEARPIIGQEQFPGNLHGIDVLNTRGASPDGYCDGWGEPGSHGHDRIGPGHVCPHGIRWPWACDECDRAAYEDRKS